MTNPAAPVALVGARADLARSKPALVTENALPRQQRRILWRGVKWPRCTPAKRALLVLLASRLRTRRRTRLIVQPETVLRWHRQGFRLRWRRKSRATALPTPKVVAEPIALIHTANRLWGAERICGELRRLGNRVAKTTAQRYMRQSRAPGEPLRRGTRG